MILLLAAALLPDLGASATRVVVSTSRTAQPGLNVSETAEPAVVTISMTVPVEGGDPPRTASTPPATASGSPPSAVRSVGAAPVLREASPPPATPAPSPASAAPAHVAEVVPAGSTGVASWYSGRPATCDGHPVPSSVTGWAANRTLPCGMLVTLTGPFGSIVVPIEDRGPWVAGRDWDLPPSVFRVLFGDLGAGTGRVTWRQGS